MPGPTSGTTSCPTAVVNTAPTIITGSTSASTAVAEDKNEGNIINENQLHVLVINVLVIIKKQFMFGNVFRQVFFIL